MLNLCFLLAFVDHPHFNDILQSVTMYLLSQKSTLHMNVVGKQRQENRIQICLPKSSTVALLGGRNCLEDERQLSGV